MIRYIVSAACITLMLMSAECCLGQVPIVTDGQTRVTVVLPAQPLTSEQLAADVLAKYLALVGTRPSVVNEPATFQGPAVSIGRTRLAASAGVTDEGLIYDGYRLQTKNKTVFVIGRDVPPPTPAAFYVRLGVTGTYKGALALLEEMGFRFVQPSQAGVFVPSGQDIALPDTLDFTHRPPFAYTYFGRPEWQEWNVANNFRVATRLFTGGGHTWPEFISPSLFDEHPEYFRMEDGQRIRPTVAGALFLCPSNAEVAKLLASAVRQRFDQGYDLVELAQSDGYKPCQCAPCRAMDLPDEHHEQVHLLHQKVTADVARTHPDKKVMLLIYPPTDVASRHIEQYGDNVLLEVCNVNEANLAKWSAKAPGGLTSYVYYMGPPSAQGSAPRFTPAMAQTEIRKLARHNVQGIYFCGGGANWGGEGPTHYALGRLIGDPSLEASTLLDEYCRFTFGEASQMMRQFYQLWFERIEDTATLGTREHFIAAYPPPVLERLTSLLQLARSQAVNDARATGWIDSAALSLDHVRYIANVFHAYGGYEVAPSIDTLIAVRDRVNTHLVFSKTLGNLTADRPGFVAKFLPGWSFYWMRKAYGSIESNYSSLNAPFGWNFDLLLAKGLLPGTARPVAIAQRRTAAISIDGKLDDAGWQDLSWHELNQASLGDITAQTRFAVTYDDDKLYFAIEAHEPLIDSMVVQAFGHDGGVYATECVELFFDPEASTQRMMHLIATPTDTGTYDGRLGYIDDPLHPLVISGLEDKSWNPAWRHGYHIDGDAKRWTVEFAVPFASLDQSTPASGQRWRFNVGRERFPGNFRNATPSMYGDLYLWSPNLEAQRFCVPAIFGDLYFDRIPTP